MKKTFLRKQENNEFQNLLAIMSPRGVNEARNGFTQPSKGASKKTPITQKKPLSRNVLQFSNSSNSSSHGIVVS